MPNKRADRLNAMAASDAALASNLAVVSTSAGVLQSSRYDVLMGALARIMTVHVVTDPRYGAKGNGTADDTTKIQDAIDDLPSTGGVVLLPGGRFRTTSDLIIRNNGTILMGASGVGAKLVGSGTVYGASQIICEGATHGIIRCRGTNDDGTTIMQAGPVVTGLTLIDAAGQENFNASGTGLGSLKGLFVQAVNGWRAERNTFAFLGEGVDADKDDSTGNNADNANWLIQHNRFSFCTIGADLNTYTGYVMFNWWNGCPTGVKIDKRVFNQACSNIWVAGGKMDILDPASSGNSGYTPGYGFDIGAVQGLTVDRFAWESQPNTSSSFGTTAIRIAGDTTNTRVVVRDPLFSNVDKGIDCVTARYLRVENADFRTRTAGTTMTSGIAVDNCADVVLTGCKSDTASFPPIRLTTNSGIVTIDGYLGDVIGTTTENGKPRQVWSAGAIKSWTDQAGVSSSKALLRPIATKTAAYNLTAADHTILANATSAAFTVSLPDPTTVPSGQEYTVKKIDSSANAVTLSRTTSGVIDGSNTKSLAAQYSTITVRSNGVNWYVVNQI